MTDVCERLEARTIENSVVLTCFTSGDYHRGTWGTTPDAVHGYHIELVLRVRAETPNMVIHRRDTGYLGECLVHVLRFMLNYVVLQLIRSFVRPAQLHRRRRDVGHLNILWWAGKSYEG